MEKTKPMLLKDFFNRFPDDESCIDYFKDIRLSLGMICPKCSGTNFKWYKGSRIFQCATCGYRFPLTKGTVMEKSHLPMYDWFFTANMMTSIKQVLSAKEIQHQLEKKYYPPVWLMMMKYRDIMGKRDAMYKLSDEVEIDISFFPTSSIVNVDGEDVIKTQKTPVLVIAESKPVDGILAEYFSKLAMPEYINRTSALLQKAEKMNIKKAVQCIKMYSMPNQQYETIRPYIEGSVSSDTKAVTDGGHNLIKLKEILKEHKPYPETEDEIHEVVKSKLPWVHIITGECRSGIEAIHKDIDERFLQPYLNEYCWKFNRRFFRDSKKDKYDLFDHLIRTAAQYTSDIKMRDYEKAINSFNVY
jgi:hypothetical protein